MPLSGGLCLHWPNGPLNLPGGSGTSSTTTPPPSLAVLFHSLTTQRAPHPINPSHLHPLPFSHTSLSL